MLLKSYLRRQQLTVTEFGRLVNATPSVVRSWINGRIPSPKYMKEIYRVTRGNVDANEFYGLKPKIKEEAAE